MAENSKIEWTHHTFNPWRGCTKVSEGCKFCYAETMSGRNPSTLGVWGPRGTRVVAAESYWRQPLKWDKAAQAAGERHRVFCASLADVFEGPETMPESDWPKVEAARERLFDLIWNTPHLDWLLLTKRPQNIADMLPWTLEHAGEYRDRPWPNVWIGASAENQEWYDKRLPHMREIPAAVKFWSMEPLVGPIRMADNDPARWIIVGGESGGQARPMHPQWARSLRDQAQAAGAAFFFKQWGEWTPWPDHLEFDERAPVFQFPVTYHNGEHWAVRYEPVYRIGKHAAGRLLDGREWNEAPS